jgi:hypothetical protein
MASRNRTPMLTGLTERLDLIGRVDICSNALNMLSTLQQNGYGDTIVNDHTWNRVALRHIRSSPGPHDVCI